MKAGLARIASYTRDSKVSLALQRCSGSGGRPSRGVPFRSRRSFWGGEARGRMRSCAPKEGAEHATMRQACFEGGWCLVVNRSRGVAGGRISPRGAGFRSDGISADGAGFLARARSGDVVGRIGRGCRVPRPRRLPEPLSAGRVGPRRWPGASGVIHERRCWRPSTSDGSCCPRRGAGASPCATSSRTSYPSCSRWTPGSGGRGGGGARARRRLGETPYAGREAFLRVLLFPPSDDRIKGRRVFVAESATSAFPRWRFLPSLSKHAARTRASGDGDGRGAVIDAKGKSQRLLSDEL